MIKRITAISVIILILVGYAYGISYASTEKTNNDKAKNIGAISTDVTSTKANNTKVNSTKVNSTNVNNTNVSNVNLNNVNLNNINIANNTEIIGWQYVNTKADNLNLVKGNNLVNRKSILTKVDILSPNWLSLKTTGVKNDSVILDEKIDKTYINLARRNGYKVWVTIEDNLASSANLTTKLNILEKNKIAAEALSEKLVGLLVDNKIDGLNFSLKNVDEKSVISYMNLVGIITEKLHKKSMVSSISISTKENEKNLKIYEGYKEKKVFDYILVKDSGAKFTKLDKKETAKTIAVSLKNKDISVKNKTSENKTSENKTSKNLKNIPIKKIARDNE